MGKSAIAKAMRARARDVRQDGAYCGLLEIAAWCWLKKVHVLLAFGLHIVNVYRFCGDGLPDFKPKKIQRLIAVQASGDKLLSADKPGVSVPDANHFVIGRSAHGKQALDTSEHVSAPRFLPDGSRRAASDVALDLYWRIMPTVCQGDCLIDCLAYWTQKSRDAISWNKSAKSLQMALRTLPRRWRLPVVLNG